jgi:hypothetical protein
MEYINPYTSAHAIRTERAICGNFYMQDSFLSYKSVSQGLTTINRSVKKVPMKTHVF